MLGRILGANFGVDFGADLECGFLARIFARIFQLGVRIFSGFFRRRRETAEPCIFLKILQNPDPKSSHLSGPHRQGLFLATDHRS